MVVPPVGSSIIKVHITPEILYPIQESSKPQLTKYKKRSWIAWLWGETTRVTKLREITGKTQVLYSELGEITGKTRVLPSGNNRYYLILWIVNACLTKGRKFKLTWYLLCQKQTPLVHLCQDYSQLVHVFDLSPIMWCYSQLFERQRGYEGLCFSITSMR